MRESHPISEELLEALAAAAHAIWRERMLAAGWKPGEKFDAIARTHDGLRPFAELSAVQRDQIASWITSHELHDHLCEVADIALRTKELLAADLRVGAAVREVDDGDPDADSETIGRVVDWHVLNPKNGRLDFIRVRWDDGNIFQYAPYDLELVGANV